MQIEEAINLVKARIQKTGEVASDIVRDLWSRTLKFDREILDLLAQEGLRYRVNNDIHFRRDFSEESRGFRVAVSEREKSADPLNVLVSVMYQCNSGQMVALIDFTKEDFQYGAVLARGKAAGFMEVAHFMDRGYEVLDHHQVHSVRELPRDVQVTLAEKWPRS